MSCVESWSEVPAPALEALVAHEIARWHDQLHWDTRALWRVVEHARRAHRLPGVVARADDGGITGYTYWTVRGGEVQCGALTAESPDTAARLLDAVEAAGGGPGVAPVRLFGWLSAPGTGALLSARGFALGAHAYLAAAANAPEAARPVGRSWDCRDLEATIALLGASYDSVDLARPFAPRGTVEEWREYASELVLGHGCGIFRSSLSLAVPGPSGEVDAVALVTDIGAGSAHLAQLAVHPARRASGMASRIVTRVLSLCAAAGYRRLTLLAREGNRPAERLYARLGFQPRASFTSAYRSVLAPRDDAAATRST